MSKSHKQQAGVRAKAASPKPAAAQKPKKTGGKRFALKPCKARWMVYAIGGIALFAFLFWGYGDVLHRAQQDSYISTSDDTMYYLLTRPMGELYWVARWALLVFKSTLLGCLCLALVYTLTARLADYALRIPRTLEGIGFIVPLAQVAWILYRGTNLYYKNEPSLFIVIAVAVLAVAALLALVVWLIVRKKEVTLPATVRPYGLLIALVLTGATTWAALRFNENVILTARLQNLAAEQAWDEMIEEARSARQPSRAVAAYHAVALEETDQLANGAFEIPYEFPKLSLDSIDGNEEYGLFLADCNYHAGLLNPAYRCAMDHVVMNGPRVYYYKRMALCALLNGEKALCQKYLTLIGQMPFEGDFVEKYEPMLRDSTLIEQDAELKHVLSLAPKEDTFEQNYQPPAFLGYNTGLRQGTDASLTTSIVACLYSKDLKNFLMRAQVYAQKGMQFSPYMQEAIAILALKQPELLQSFPQVGRYVPDQIRAFLLDAKPYIKDRLALRHELRERWLGTYVYYYYTENNDPEQLAKDTSAKNKAGVN